MSAAAQAGLVSGALYRCEAGEVHAGHCYAWRGVTGRCSGFVLDKRGVPYAVLVHGVKTFRVNARKLAESLRAAQA